MLLKIILFSIFSFSLLYSQSKDPEEILERVKKEFEKVNDYQADISVKVDIPFLKMPERKATLYYKKPDKIHIESEGFAMLPKEGINFSPVSLLESEHTAFYERDEMMGGVNTAVIKIIPLNDKSNVLLGTLWIDPVKHLVLKVESSRKPTGTITIEFDYTQIESEYHLPKLIEFTFSVDPTMFQSRNRRGMDIDEKTATEDSSKVKTGKVYINYSNYEVNKGIPDSLFNSK